MTAPPNCVECGRFVAVGADNSTPFGHSWDMEPPDPVFYCDSCAHKMEEKAVSSGDTFWLNDWIKADWQRRAAKRLGLIECSPKGAAWSQFHKSVPEGWEQTRLTRD